VPGPYGGPAVRQQGQVQFLGDLVEGIEVRVVEQLALGGLRRDVDADQIRVPGRPVADLGHARDDVAHVGHHRPLEARWRLGAEVGHPPVVGTIERVLEPHVAERAVARDVGRIEHADVHAGAIHVLEAGLDVPAHLGADRRQRLHAPGRERPATALHTRPPGEPERVAPAERPASLDRLDERRAAAEERVRVACLGLLLEGLTQLPVRVLIRGIEIVAVEAVRPLHDVGIEVDHRRAVPTHLGSPWRRSRAAGQRPWWARCPDWRASIDSADRLKMSGTGQPSRPA
jgi:hypothetical protein